MLDIREEQKYQQLRELGQELHIPIFEAFLELEVKDKDGNVIQYHKQRSHSWVRNAFNWMFSQLAGKDATDTTFGAGLLSTRTTGGVVVGGGLPITLHPSASVDGTGGGYRAPAATATNGIVVGSGTVAESFGDFALATPIGEGIAAGQLNYTLSNPHAITWDGVARIFRNTFVRFMNNNSGGSVNVNEVALIPQIMVGGSWTPILVARDLLPATIVVPNTGQLRVSYVISLVYPA